ncbi:MAG: methylmalonyl-CoA mutase [Mesoaciditoga sp.]|uniref:acyl-CoA mutase large subunit family protein n=1 Tax=Athalassotoga sp. TaxID=2022597 RepID=UPI000CB9B7F9|nr:MAG: methylmalonyl-CoA mutase [Mesoaciditoga sp.]HEU24774.1 methylmalonyl-CoA mutase [Mesoaciditoga lauensis]
MMDESIKKSYEEWEKQTESLIKKYPEEGNFKTTWSDEVKRLYTPLDVGDYSQIGFPGEFPYTRGVQNTMYRGKLWTMRQYAGFGTAEESNKRYKYLLEQGQSGLSIAFDLPTQIGYDSDDPHSLGEVGKVGVAIDSLADMETLFDGIPLDKVSTSMTINATASILLAMYIAVGEKQGVKRDKLRGTIQNDILKEYIARGTYIYPPKPSMRIINNIFEFCSKEMPLWNTISVSGYHIREAGANAVQEVAFTIADGIEYVKTAIEAGLDPNVFGKRLSFFFASHNNLLEEVAKFRAARRMWAKIMKERFNVKDPDALKLRFHTQTSGSTLTAQQPENNIIRVTIQALAAVLGGTQSLHTNSMDEALSLPTEDSVRIALRTQQIIAYESGVAKTVDPLGGSYYVEALTDEIERRAFDYIKRIDEIGGMINAIESGYVQQEISNSAYEYQKAVESKEQIIVGVNDFVIEEKNPRKTLKIDDALEIKQIEKLRSMKSKRDNDAVREKLENLERAARTSENLMYPIIDAVKVYATVGEISNTLRKVFGEYKESVIF